MDDEPTLRFADAAETERRQALLERFLREVLGLPWAFVSDESHLSDFDGVLPRDELIARCRALYGQALEPHHFSMPIWRVLDELEAAGNGRDLN
jgi:Mn-dependent DtxR family transcriptional regulator